MENIAKIKELLRDERGVGTIEIILILVVLVALVLLFKNQILGLVDSIFANINQSVTEIY